VPGVRFVPDLERTTNTATIGPGIRDRQSALGGKRLWQLAP